LIFFKNGTTTYPLADLVPSGPAGTWPRPHRCRHPITALFTCMWWFQPRSCLRSSAWHSGPWSSPGGAKWA